MNTKDKKEVNAVVRTGEGGVKVDVIKQPNKKHLKKGQTRQG